MNYFPILYINQTTFRKISMIIYTETYSRFINYFLTAVKNTLDWIEKVELCENILHNADALLIQHQVKDEW